jgi:hypothetical protein
MKTQTQREDSNVKMETDWSDAPQTKSSCVTRSWTRPGRLLLQRLWRKHGLSDTSVLVFQPPEL